MTELIIKTKVKQFFKERELNTAGETLAKANEIFIILLEKASERAKANGRRTIQAKDL